MSVKKPKSITVFGKKVPVEFVDGFDDPQLYGIFDQHHQKITVMNCKQWRQILYHEAIHAALFFGGVSQSLGEKLEESVVHCLEHGLGKFFKI